jgi:hypothetical protein
MRFIAILTSLLFVGDAYPFGPAVYGEFHNTLPFTVTVELTNRSGITITSGETGKSPVTNGIARVFDSKGHEVAEGATVKPSEKAFFDFERRTFYYEIHTRNVVATNVEEGRKWLGNKKDG